MVLVGGVSLGGGVGSITGVALGALLLGEIQNALGVAQLDPVWSNVIVGVILATAVALDQLRGRVRFRDTSLTGHEPTAPSVNRLELQRLISGRAPEAERIMTAVSSERRRIQRDLHDGAQQQLVNASLILQLAIDQLRASGDDQIVDLLDGSREKLRTALAELRDLSRGIYPVVLREYGLISAIESLARRNAIPTQLDAGDMPQLPEHVAMAAYFLVAEALTNTVKHAHAARVSITVRHEDGALHVSVSDDGVGGADEANGSGIRGLRERIEAVQGYLVVNSAAGTGTRLIARLPTHALAK
jgi:signal transduction histidine kinase